MKFRNIFIYLLIVIVMMGVSGCGKKAVEPNATTTQVSGTIFIPLVSEPDIINPVFANGEVAALVSNMVYSPLYVYKKGKVTNYLAESVDFEGSKVMTIKLKKNLRWHDGKNITADDMVFTLNTIIDEKQNSPLRQSLLLDGKPVTVEKVDGLTVKITLPVASATFMYNMSKIYPIPKHIFHDEKLLLKSQRNNNPIGSGPFKFKEWKKTESIILERYDEYFGGKPKAKAIAIKIIPNETSRQVALNNEELTLMKAGAELFNKSKFNTKLQTYTYSERRLNYIVYNQNMPAMKNEKVRKAINYALDRKEMIKSAYGDIGSKEAKSILIPEADYYTDDVAGYERDLKDSQKLIAESGEKITKLKIAYNSERFGHKNYATVAKQQLKAIGVEVEIVPYESKDFHNALFSKNTEIHMFINGYAWGLDPNSYRGMFETGTYYNKTAYSNAKVDALWNRGFSETNAEKREDIYEDIQEEVAEDAAIYTIDYEQNLMVAQKYLKGIEEAHPTGGIMFQDWSKLYIEKQQK